MPVVILYMHNPVHVVLLSCMSWFFNPLDFQENCALIQLLSIVGGWVGVAAGQTLSPVFNSLWV